MSRVRYIQQRLMTGFSFSLLLHGGAAIALVLAPTHLLPEAQELAQAIYFDDVSTALPKGTQTAALPAAGTSNDDQGLNAPSPNAGDNTPVAKAEAAPVTEGDVIVPAKVAAKIVEKKPAPKALPKKPVPPSALPDKTKVVDTAIAPVPLTSDDSDVDVRSALDEARTEKTEESDWSEAAEASVAASEEDLETNEIDTNLAVAEQVAQEPEVEEEETPAPVAVAPLIREENVPTQQPQTIPPPAAQAARVPAPGVQNRLPPAQSASNDASASGSTGAVGGIGTKQSFGIRDANELKAVPGNRAPAYPERDRLMRNQGTAVFVARVLPDGTVTEIQLERSSQSRSLDTSALEAMRKWRFQPGQQGMVRKGFTFSLDGEAEEIPARLRR